jgi:transcriptional regulator with XRE-family HTH domain
MPKKTIPVVQNRIREFRERKGLSRAKLGDLVKTSLGQIQKLELGERKLTQEWMVRLAAHLDCSPVDLLPIDAISGSDAARGRIATPLLAHLLPALAALERGHPELERLKTFDPVSGTGTHLVDEIARYRRVPDHGASMRQLKAEQGAESILSLATQSQFPHVIITTPPFLEKAPRPYLAKEIEALKEIGYEAYLQAVIAKARQLLKNPGDMLVARDGRIFLADQPGKAVARVIPNVGRLAAGPWQSASRPFAVDLGDPANHLSVKVTSPEAFSLDIPEDFTSGLNWRGGRVVVDPAMPPQKGWDIVLRRKYAVEYEGSVFLGNLVKLDTLGGAKYTVDYQSPKRQTLRHRFDTTQVEFIGSVVERVPKAA